MRASAATLAAKQSPGSRTISGIEGDVPRVKGCILIRVKGDSLSRLIGMQDLPVSSYPYAIHSVPSLYKYAALYTIKCNSGFVNRHCTFLIKHLLLLAAVQAISSLQSFCKLNDICI